ncbi:MAG: prepilin-type N-terminal cleavage/methylation domain-containing protein [Candidatus Paceibacterota bacterium]|jgi:type II secretion system protein I
MEKILKFLFRKSNKLNQGGFTQLVDFGDAISSRTKSASPKFTTGFTLVEVLVAISIFTVSLIGIMSVLASGIANTNYAKQKMIATYLAQEGIEYIRNMRDTAVLYGNGNPWEGSFKAQLSSCNDPDEDNNPCGLDEPPFGVTVCTNPSDCRLYLDNGNYSTTVSVVDSGFIRKIWMVPIGAGNTDEVKIFSRVEWTQGSGGYNVTFSENLFNWIEI